MKNISGMIKGLESMKKEYGELEVCIAKDNLEFQYVTNITSVSYSPGDNFIVISNFDLSKGEK